MVVVRRVGAVKSGARMTWDFARQPDLNTRPESSKIALITMRILMAHLTIVTDTSRWS